VTAEEILQSMNTILHKQGKPEISNETAELRDIGFRSLDFSELALRVETAVDAELTFDAAALRSITTVRDVVDFFTSATADL
jgi:acyl carrier protein